MPEYRNRLSANAPRRPPQMAQGGQRSAGSITEIDANGTIIDFVRHLEDVILIWLGVERNLAQRGKTRFGVGQAGRCLFKF